MSVTDDLSAPQPTMSLSDLESELLGLAGHIAAAECRFLQLLAEFDRRGGWNGVGVRSCAHWLAWRAGMSLRTATEHLRVAHALTDLPLVTAAFAAGRISYSKVRAITRVTGSDTTALARLTADGSEPTADRVAPGAAESGDEHPTAGIAGGGSGTSDLDSDTTDPATSDSTTSDSATSDSDLTDRHTDVGAARTAADGRTDGAAATPVDPTDPATAEKVLLDLALSGTASHVETVVRAARRRTVRPGDLAARRGLTWHHDTDGSLVVRGRLTPEDGAALIAAIDARLPAPAPAGDPDTAPPDDLDRRAVEQEPGPAVDRLAARRADALLELVRHHDDPTGPVVARGTAEVVVHLDGATGTARLAGGPEIPASTAERLACDARARVLLDDRATNRMYLGRSRRLASPAQIAALTARDSADGGGCRFPGCDRTRHLHAHHVRSWLRGGATDIDNLILLCGYHHRLVHEHGYRIRYRSSEGWEIRRPDGLPVAPTGEPLTGHAEGLIEINTRAGVLVDSTTLTPAWYGDRLDPQPILDALLPPRAAGAAAA